MPPTTSLLVDPLPPSLRASLKESSGRLPAASSPRHGSNEIYPSTIHLLVTPSRPPFPPWTFPRAPRVHHSTILALSASNIDRKHRRAAQPPPSGPWREERVTRQRQSGTDQHPKKRVPALIRRVTPLASQRPARSLRPDTRREYLAQESLSLHGPRTDSCVGVRE